MNKKMEMRRKTMVPLGDMVTVGTIDTEFVRRRLMRNRDIPPKFKKLYERATRGKSRKASIRYFCLECVGWLPKEVELCTDQGCSHYPYRITG